MGSRVQKIAFLIFALMFVAIMAILNTTILTMGTSANNQLTTTVTSDDSALQIYDQGDVYGSAVVTCAKDPGKVASTDMTIYVITAADPNGHKYTSTEDGKYDGSGDASTAINKNAKFKSYLCTNANGVTTGILFVQDSAKDANTTLVTDDGLTIQGLNTNS